MFSTKPKDYFDENIRAIDPKTNPAELNLNKGLSALSETIQNLEKHITEIESKLKLGGLIK